MTRFSFVALVLLLASIGVSGAVVATPTDSPTTGNATTTRTATATTTPDVAISADRVRSLLEDSGSWSREQAKDVYRFVRNGSLGQLGEEETRTLYRRLLRRAANQSVPSDVLGSASGVIDAETARAIARDVTTSLPDDAASTLSDRLQGSGAESAIAGVAQAIAAGASTPTATRTPGRAALPSNGTIYADLGTVDLVAWEYDAKAGEMVLTFRAQSPTDVVVSDALGPIANEGVSEIPKRKFTIRGERTVRMAVTKYRSSAAVAVSTRQTSIYVSTGISIGNPFEGGSPTVGWFGGSAVAVLMFVSAGYWTLSRESVEPRKAKRGVKRRNRE